MAVFSLHYLRPCRQLQYVPPSLPINCIFQGISSRDLNQLRKDACPGGRGQITVADSGKVNWKDVRDMELEEFFHQTQSLVVPENSIISIDSKQLKVLNFGQLNAIKGPASARMKIVDSGVEAVDFSRLDIEIAVEIRHNKQLGKILFGEGKAYNIYGQIYPVLDGNEPKC